MAESLIEWFAAHLGGVVSKEFLVLIVSMFPILECRGGMIAARLWQVPYPKAAAASIVGNLLPLPLVLLLITPLFNKLRETKLFRPLVEKLEKRAMGKSDKIQKAEFWGLLLFVGIPLPGTGAWTGSLIASMLKINKKKAFLAIVLGVILAMVIMSVITYVIPWIVAWIAAR